MPMSPYLFFAGECAEAFRFYEQCLHGKVTLSMTYGGSPMASHVPPEHHALIMHIRLEAGDMTLMGADATPDRFRTPQGFAVSLGIEKPEEAERLFHALAEGGTVQMPIEKTFWAQRFGMLVDRFGTPWMINCD